MKKFWIVTVAAAVLAMSLTACIQVNIIPGGSQSSEDGTKPTESVENTEKDTKPTEPTADPDAAFTCEVKDFAFIVPEEMRDYVTVTKEENNTCIRVSYKDYTMMYFNVWENPEEYTGGDPLDMNTRVREMPDGRLLCCMVTNYMFLLMTNDFRVMREDYSYKGITEADMATLLKIMSGGQTVDVNALRGKLPGDSEEVKALQETIQTYRDKMYEKNIVLK